MPGRTGSADFSVKPDPARWRAPRRRPRPGRRDLGPPATVRREHAVVPRQVRPRSRHQRRQPRHEVQRLEDHVGGAVPIRRLQHLAQLTLAGEGQPLDLLPFIGPGGDARVQGEAVGARREVPGRLCSVKAF